MISDDLRISKGQNWSELWFTSVRHFLKSKSEVEALELEIKRHKFLWMKKDF